MLLVCFLDVDQAPPLHQKWARHCMGIGSKMSDHAPGKSPDSSARDPQNKLSYTTVIHMQ